MLFSVLPMACRGCLGFQESMLLINKMLEVCVSDSNFRVTNYSQALLLEWLPFRTVWFLTILLMEKMSQLSNKTSVLGMTTLSC